MRSWLTASICTMLLALASANAPAIAQQKSVKACQDEWRANKDDNQKKGITERSYVAQCRAGSSTAQPQATSKAGTPKATQATPGTGTEGQKSVKACQDEWRANRAGYQSAKITEKSYVEKCRAGETIALPSTAGQQPTTTTNEKATTVTKPPATTNPGTTTTTATKPSTTTPRTTSATDQYQTEALAKAQCAGDVVVWANLKSKIYHFAGYKSYGTTKNGSYMCEKGATAQGFRASKTEKRPSA